MLSDVTVCLLSPKAVTYRILEKFTGYESLNAVQKEIPRGVYTTFRTFQRTKVVNLNGHFERLRESAMILGCPISIDPDRIRAALRQMIDKSGFPESRIRLSLDLSVNLEDLYILIESLVTPEPEEYERGVRVCTRYLHREKPKAKSTDFVERADQERRDVGPGINEILMISPDGIILEGLSSNFFAVKDGVIWTDDESVLSGMTREVVLEVLRDLGLPVVLRGYHTEKIDFIQEAFITSASRGVLPVNMIDHQLVGEGKPGPITKRIMEGYQQKIDNMMLEL